MRPIGSASELERRRRQAVSLLNQGESPAVISRILGVARGSLYRWKAQSQQPEGLKARAHPGPRPRLTEEQEFQLEVLLMAGATRRRWANELWTASRVGQLIRRYFGIQYHPDHVRKVLKKRLGWTSQQPQYRARERHNPRIDLWRRQEMRRIKKIS